MDARDVAYFDNAATTFPKLPIVMQKSMEFIMQYGVNAGRGQYDIAAIANNMIKETRHKLLDLLHGKPEQTVVFTPSATIAFNMILQGQRYREGQVIYISHFEHNAVTRTLGGLKTRHRLKIRYLSMQKDSTDYDIDGIRKQFAQEPPHYVVVNHVSNVCGLIAPITEICKAAKEYGAVNVVDMSQSAGLLDINLAQLKADYCVFAGHKTLLSLFGVGGFICRSDAKLDCLLYGGTGLKSADAEMPIELPERCEPGSLNTGAIASLNAAIDYIKATGREIIESDEQKNKERLLVLLKQYENIKLVGESRNSTGIISCVFKDYAPDNVGNILNGRGIAVRTGLHCAPDAHRYLGTFGAGTVRFSVSSFTAENDFQKLKTALDIIREAS